MIKTAFAPHLGRHVKFGRKRPVAKCPRMGLGRYMSSALPTPPTQCDYSKPAMSVLTDVMRNDELGDCVVAGGYHIVGVATGNAGTPYHATAQQITADYSAIGGYVPGRPETDQGCNEETALNYWMQHGFANGTKLLGWLAVDATNKQQVMTAMYLFENLVFGVELPDAWINPFPAGNGFTWGVAGAPDMNNGHCFVGVGYNTAGVQIDTWGLIGTVTWDAVAQYASSRSNGELYVMLTPDQLAKGAAKAPNGFDWSTLIADFDALGGHVPVPVPTPPPPAPGPVPPSPAVTLAQAEEWATSDLKVGFPWLTRSQAAKIVKASLASKWPK